MTPLPADTPASSAVDDAARPGFLSVIVAARDAAAMLPHSLAALAASHLPREEWELIVVDDGSSDATAQVAAEYADVVIRLPLKPHGPAYARNRGCEVAAGDVVVFVDADVCVYPDALGWFSRILTAKPWLGAVFGAYDAEPPARGVVSRFRNLLHHYVHASNAGEAETFWAGCGAVRREVLRDAQMFDEWHYDRPQIEDIDLGRRLRRRGHRILLCPEIRCAHLKRWTLRGMVATDFSNRGVPWMRILLQERVVSEFQSLNLRNRERLRALLAVLGVACLLAAPVSRAAPLALVGAASILALWALNTTFYVLLYRRGGARLALAGLGLHLIYYLVAVLAAGAGLLAHVVLGEPAAAPESAAQAAIGLVTWPPGPRPPADHLWRSPAFVRGRPMP